MLLPADRAEKKPPTRNEWRRRMNNAKTAPLYRSTVKRIEFPIVLFVIIVFFVFSSLSENFSNIQNIKLIALQISINGICAIGMTMAVLLGGINLSIGSVLALCATCAGLFNNMGMPLPLIVLLSVLIGGLCGVLNGFLIVRFRIPDIIATLATMSIIRGLAVTISGGKWVTNFTEDFSRMGQGFFLGLPFPFIVFIVLALAFGLFLSHFNWGRKLYAIGGNKEAAMLIGINEGRIRATVYIIDGMLIGLAAVLYAAMMANVQASTAGNNMTNLILASVLIGGASIFGGKGTLLGTAFGVFLMGMIRNGMILIKASEYWVDAITGGLIILALIINIIQQKGLER